MLAPVSDLVLERDQLAVDLVQGQVERRLRVLPTLPRVQRGRPPAVEVDQDPADERGEVARLPLFGELELGIHDLAEVVDEPVELALRRIAHFLPETVGTVVQDDLHDSDYKRVVEGCLAPPTSVRACIPEAAGTAP